MLPTLPPANSKPCYKICLMYMTCNMGLFCNLCTWVVIFQEKYDFVWHFNNIKMYFYFFTSVRKWNKCINDGDLPPSVWNGQHLQLAVKYAWQSIISNSIKSVTSPDNSNPFCCWIWDDIHHWTQSISNGMGFYYKQLKLIDVPIARFNIYAAGNSTVVLCNKPQDCSVTMRNWDLTFAFVVIPLPITFYTCFAGSLVLIDKK